MKLCQLSAVVKLRIRRHHENNTTFRCDLQQHVEIDVHRFQIAMDESGGMESGKSAADLQQVVGQRTIRARQFGGLEKFSDEVRTIGDQAGGDKTREW